MMLSRPSIEFAQANVAAKGQPVTTAPETLGTRNRTDGSISPHGLGKQHRDNDKQLGGQDGADLHGARNLEQTLQNVIGQKTEVPQMET
eukprot:6914463-Pyramimonas_sp.AAC.1